MKKNPASPVVFPEDVEQSRFALALTAGGARGAYQIGCWKAFLEHGISFGAVAGSSIGALNAAFVCQGDFDAAYAFWQELAETRFLTPDYARLRRLFVRLGVDVALFMAPVPNLRTVRVVKYAAASAKLLSRYGSLGALAREGLIRIEDLEPLLRRHLDLKQVIGRPVSLFTTVTEITGLGNDRLGPRWFRLQDLDEESALKILAASLSLPFVSERIVVNGRSYVDGGIAQWAPMMPLYKGGSRKIVVVSTKAGLSCNPQDYPAATLHVIKPERPLGRFPLATFRFTRHAIIRWMSQGYQDASIFLDANPLR